MAVTMTKPIRVPKAVLLTVASAARDCADLALLLDILGLDSEADDETGVPTRHSLASLKLPVDTNLGKRAW